MNVNICHPGEGRRYRETCKYDSPGHCGPSGIGVATARLSVAEDSPVAVTSRDEALFAAAGAKLGSDVPILNRAEKHRPDEPDDNSGLYFFGGEKLGTHHTNKNQQFGGANTSRGK